MGNLEQLHSALWRDNQSGRLNMIGFRSGRLFVLTYSHTRAKRAFWHCRCDCGREVNVMGKYLRRGDVKSCGCLNRQPLAGPRIKHGHAQGVLSPTYRVWAGMLQRCETPSCSAYYKYGGRGIRVCRRWHDFCAFLEDMGERPLGKTLGRLDNNGPYRKSNCRWETLLEQGANSRRNRVIAFGGERLHLAAWARRLGVKSSTLHQRIARLGVDRAFAYER